MYRKFSLEMFKPLSSRLAPGFQDKVFRPLSTVLSLANRRISRIRVTSGEKSRPKLNQLHPICKSSETGDPQRSFKQFALHIPKGINVEEEILSPSQLERLDELCDSLFYANACFAQHVDGSFLERLSKLYEQLLDPQYRVLDLCSSFDSHLPPKELVPLEKVVGHGMNATELSANLRLDSFFVHDLNGTEEIRFPLADGEVNAVLCCCGFQYLTRPMAVLKECRRVLSPGGLVVFSFSSHSWAAKATAAWLQSSTNDEKCRLVERHLHAAGFADIRVVKPAEDSGGASSGGPDPFLAVVAWHPAVPAAATVAEASLRVRPRPRPPASHRDGAGRRAGWAQGKGTTTIHPRPREAG
mmetsp:Transcript_31283/g.74335  ORF Transcript_31283/g.74335 Transcript_31283/m.74335 type:complete len:356 (+) Transcript_31283:72-1139(+)